MAQEILDVLNRVSAKGIIEGNPRYQEGVNRLSRELGKVLAEGNFPLSAEPMPSKGDLIENKPVFLRKLHVEHSDASQLGQRAKALRKQRNESIRAVAKRAGFSAIQLSRIERLQASPTAEKIVGLANALEVPISVLFGEIEKDMSE
jgi:hypothetical protein